MLINDVNNRQQCSKWWSKVYGSSIRLINIVYIAGKGTQYADALLKQPVLSAPPDNGASKEVQTALFPVVEVEDINTFLHKKPDNATNCSSFTSFTLVGH